MVIDEQSISNASKKLHVTQPAISKLVKRIEESFNIELFDRNKYPWQLTEVGILFKEYCTNVLKEHEKLLDKIDEIVLDRKGSLTFGAMAYEDRYLLPDILTKFYEKHPSFKINIFLNNSKKMEHWLIEQKVAFALVVLPVKSEAIKAIFLRDYEIIVGIPNAFLLEKQIKIPKSKELGQIDLSLFKDKPFILRQQQLGFRTHENNILKKSSIIPSTENIIEVAQYNTSISLVNKDMGICFILDDVLNYIEKPANISFFKIKDIQPKQSLGLAYLKSRKLSETEKSLIKIMQESIFI